MTPTKSTNGKLSTSKIVITMITVLCGIVLFLAVTLRSFVSMGVVQYSEALNDVENLAHENKAKNDVQDQALATIKEDIFEIKDMTQDIYFFVSGIDPTRN